MSVTRTHTYTQPGVYTVTASDGVNTARAQVTVLDATPPVMDAQPKPVAQGGALTVTGTDFTPAANGTIQLWSGKTGGSALASKPVTVGQDGKFSIVIEVPTDAPEGDARVVADIGTDQAAPVAVTIQKVAAKLPTPTNLASGAITDTSVEVTWDAVTGADSYVVRWKLTSGGEWTERPAVDSATDTITELTKATAYDIQVKAQDSTGAVNDSDYSATLKVSTNAGTPLTVPADLAAGTITDTTIPVSWTTSVNATAYKVRYRATGTTEWTERTQVTATSDTVDGLTSGTGYDIAVKAIGDGTTYTDSDWSEPITAITTGDAPPATPTGLAAGTVAATSVPLTWDAVDGADGYVVRWKKSSDGAAAWAERTKVTDAADTVDSLTASTQYDFQVKATKGAAASAYSETVQATTASAARAKRS